VHWIETRERDGGGEKKGVKNHESGGDVCGTKTSLLTRVVLVRAVESEGGGVLSVGIRRKKVGEKESSQLEGRGVKKEERIYFFKTVVPWKKRVKLEGRKLGKKGCLNLESGGVAGKQKKRGRLTILRVSNRRSSEGWTRGV